MRRRKGWNKWQSVKCGLSFFVLCFKNVIYIDNIFIMLPSKMEKITFKQNPVCDKVLLNKTKGDILTENNISRCSNEQIFFSFINQE